MYRLLVISILFNLTALAQDRMFLTNGTAHNGTLVSMTADKIFFRGGDTSASAAYKKTEVLMIETETGRRYLFSPTPVPLTTPGKPAVFRNFLGLQPLGIFVGRATVVYELMNAKGNIGLLIPFSLTFDPFGIFYDTRDDSSGTSIDRIKGVNFITGIDVNFYVDRSAEAAFFVGPRFRYGTDVFLRNIEALTLQTQLGVKVSPRNSRMIQHASIGFGFAQVLASPAGGQIDPNQAYGWISFNYRIGLKW